MSRVFIIVLNFNGKKDTEACILSIFSSSYTNYELVIVDNGSSDGSLLYFQERFPSVTLLDTGKNLGYAGGNNVGIQYALSKNADAIFILNNDTILHQDCLREFVLASQELPHAALGGKIYTYDIPDEMQHFGGLWNPKKGKFRNVPDSTFSAEERSSLDFVTGCALFIPRLLLEKVGLFEPSFFLYYEEIDWCFRARKKGFSIIYTPHPILWHKESKSFTTPRPPQSYFQWRNRLFFMERNLPKGEFYLWMLTKFPRRWLLLVIKKWLKDLEACLFKTSSKKQIARLSYKASLQGIRDYFKRSFGKGPDWIFFPLDKS